MTKTRTTHSTVDIDKGDTRDGCAKLLIEVETWYHWVDSETYQEYDPDKKRTEYWKLTPWDGRKGYTAKELQDRVKLRLQYRIEEMWGKGAMWIAHDGDKSKD